LFTILIDVSSSTFWTFHHFFLLLAIALPSNHTLIHQRQILNVFPLILTQAITSSHLEQSFSVIAIAII
ncbi:MAG: hypothetical protein MGG37_21600, partial [Trichodesmium sp. MAG_R01]|nr:hypothetical protein [Trichodesmium sp. MAG_R01]